MPNYGQHALVVVVAALILTCLCAPAYGKGGGGGGSSSGGSSSSSSSGGKASSGSFSGSSSSASSAKTGAIAVAGGGTKAGSASSASSGSRGSSWFSGGATTQSGSTLYRGQNGRAYSSRPRYYGGGTTGYASSAMSYQKKAILWGAVGGAGLFLFYSSSYRSNRPDCYRMSFMYGNGCRRCSDWECPIGQYRSMCTPGSDSYCKLCTNAPTGMTYVTPGNNNDCEYATQDATQVNDFPDADPASLVVFMELPVDETTFNQKGEGFRTAIADVVSGTVDSVKVVSIEEFNMADVDVRDKSTTSSSSSSTSSPADSSTSADSSTAAASSSTGGCGVCGDCVPGDREAALKGCDFNTFGQCCRGRRAGGECAGNPPADNVDAKFVIVEVEIETTVGKIDDTWNKLNEYDVNREMATSCLPPAVISYDNVFVSPASMLMVQSFWVFAATTLSFALTVGN
mmetsp:Transcript_64028/g.93741  ORF Transcript_64028/g.93741 Transcript_64028/m.93741 type:complete len:456 (-) Transcript_64028:9-1376(-)